MAGRFVLAIDQGTTGTTTYLIDRAGRMFARGYCDIEQHYPSPGWVEHDPNQIWASVLVASRHTLEQAGFPDLVPRSASPTNAKPQSFGTAKAALRSRRRSSGNAAARRTFVDN